MAMDTTRILKPFVKVRTDLKKLAADPGPGEIHKLRTRMRRIEAALDALGMASHGVGRRALRHEKRFRRQAGRIRDADVLTGLAASFKTDANDELMIELLERLGAERVRQALKMHGAAQSKGQKLRKELKRCTAQLEKQIGEKADRQKKLKAAATLAARTLELCLELRAYPRLVRSNLHAFRLRVKHLRYIVQMRPESASSFIDALGEVKDKIGEWHDWEELVTLAKDLPGGGPNGGLAVKLKSTAEAKYKEALRISNQFRTRQLAAAIPEKGQLARMMARRGSVLITPLSLAA